MSDATFDEQSGLWVKWNSEAQPVFSASESGPFRGSRGMDDAMAADRVMFAAMYPYEFEAEDEATP